MSRYAQGDENQMQIASVSGWGQFGDWADTLDVGTYKVVIQLWEHGFTEELSTLRDQLIHAREHTSPIADVKGIIDAILQFLQDEKIIIIITDGMTDSVAAEGDQAIGRNVD